MELDIGTSNARQSYGSHQSCQKTVNHGTTGSSAEAAPLGVAHSMVKTSVTYHPPSHAVKTRRTPPCWVTAAMPLHGGPGVQTQDEWEHLEGVGAEVEEVVGLLDGGESLPGHHLTQALPVCTPVRFVIDPWISTVIQG